MSVKNNETCEVNLELYTASVVPNDYDQEEYDRLEEELRQLLEPCVPNPTTLSSLPRLPTVPDVPD